MVKVTFTSHNKEIYCNKGDKLLDVARNADIFIDAPCNGNVSCGKCKVRLIKGKVDTEKTHHIKDEEWNQGYILACNTKVIEDIDIEVYDDIKTMIGSCSFRIRVQARAVRAMYNNIVGAPPPLVRNGFS